MSDYVVSARKYRPDSFESLIGQEVIAKTLKNSIERGQIAHAYLFCGPRGVGKTSTARIFAKAINCSNPTKDFEPCGECESCRSFAEGRSFCIHELDAASNNGIDDMKALLEKVLVPPQVGKYSVYIIDEVHMLSQAAFNAFLKTLEEPPQHAIFILATTEKHKIIPTILSRCQTYDFNRISVPDIVSNLRGIAEKESIKIDDESLHIIAKKADGAMRDALTIFDQTVAFCGTDIHYEDVMRNLNILDYEYTFKLVDAFLSKDYGTALKTFDEILVKGFNSLHFVLSLSSHLRDLVVAKTAGLESLLDLPESLKEKYRAQAEKCSVKFLYDALTITTQCEYGYKAAVNPRLHIEFALMKLSFLEGVPGAETVTTPASTIKAPEVKATEVKAPQQPVAAAPAPAAKEPLTAPATPTVSATPAAPKRGIKALSMDSILEEEKKSAENVEQPVTQGSAKLPEDEEITGKWSEVTALYASRPRLKVALDLSKLRIEPYDGGKTLIATVTSEDIRRWILEKLQKQIEADLRKIVGSTALRFDVDVSNEVVQTKAYTPEEKMKEMMEKNPEVRNFVADLNLEV